MNSSARIIFLDFDGVLVNSKSYSRGSGSQAAADPECVAALNRSIENTGAQIVVTSTWRRGQNRALLCDLLNTWGVKGLVRDKTPFVLDDHGQHVERGIEIQKWLSETDDDGLLSVESFVILDDDSDMGELSGRLILTDGRAGLTQADADRAIEILSMVAVKP